MGGGGWEGREEGEAKGDESDGPRGRGRTRRGYTKGNEWT